LPLGAEEAVSYIYLDEIIKILEHSHIRQEAIMRGFSYLRFGIAEVDHHRPEQLGLDIKLDIFGVEVDDFECERACEEVDVFLRGAGGTFCSSMSSWMAMTMRLA
jgi:hypothetical protein